MPIKIDKEDEVRPVMLKAKQYYQMLVEGGEKPTHAVKKTSIYIGCGVDTIFRWFRILKKNKLF
jgi:hypothetical protein